MIKPLDEQIAIMTACKNGGAIEYRSYDPDKPTWYDDMSEVFNWGKSDYRIKEPTKTKSEFLNISYDMGKFIDTLEGEVKKGMMVHQRVNLVLHNYMVPDELKNELNNWLDHIVFDHIDADHSITINDYKIDTTKYEGVFPCDITYIGDYMFVDFSVDRKKRCKDTKKQ